RLIEQKRLTEAIEHFTEAIELNPDCAAAYHERGRAKLLTGDKDGAAEDMKKNLELNPKELNALNGTFDKQEEQFDTLLGFRH
ncbi:Beta-barrel assembly-enhancing protease, partial [termite gut metagenome]